MRHPFYRYGLLLCCLAGVAAMPVAAAEAELDRPAVGSGVLASSAVHTLPALLKRAVPRDPQVAAARANLASAEARYRQARSRLMPDAGIDAIRGKSKDQDSNQAVERKTQQVEASLRFNLYNGGADLAETDAAERDVAAAAADLLRAREESAERLAQAYFDVLRLERMLRLSAARRDEVALLVRQVGRQTELGKASQLDTELAQSAQLEAELAHDALYAEHSAARIKLAALAFEPQGELADFVFGALPVGGQGEAGGPALLLAARERAAAARLRVRSPAEVAAPKVDLDLRHLLNNNTSPPPSTVQRRGWSIGINWNFPLGGEKLARRDESLGRADAADAELARAEQGARAELESLAPRIASAKRALILFDAQEKKMLLLVRGGAIQFEAGRRNLQQLIQTRDNYFAIQQRRADQMQRLVLAQMRQLALSGKLLEAFELE